MSFDQDPSDFASGNFHFILHDEPPNKAIWQENEARTMRVNGRMFLAMTWSSDPGITQDWIADEIQERADSGHTDVRYWTLFTTDNANLDQDAIAAQASKWDENTRRVRLLGGRLQATNRIHPLFTDQDPHWCFGCLEQVATQDEICPLCGGGDVVRFTHVQDFDHDSRWPCVYALDPHPRKPHCMAWYQIDPVDDWWQVAELEVDADPVDLREAVEKVERDMKLEVSRRIIDPNMGKQSASAKRNTTWQGAFAEAGLYTDLADDSDVGRTRVNEYLKPDPSTHKPRFVVHERCKKTIYQMKRYQWDDHKMNLDRAQKQTPKEKNDDFPTLAKYLANTNPDFRFLKANQGIIHRRPGAGARIGRGTERRRRRM
jgi:hypothetical protein